MNGLNVRGLSLRADWPVFDSAQSVVWKWDGSFLSWLTNKYSMTKLTFFFFPFTILSFLSLDPSATNLADVR
ncbi:MAG TPA: hypothetical protein VL978_18895, partial [Puia sp.]|nr:hypothetical protein [Puia sp.]